jgi:hypothetical protein
VEREDRILGPDLVAEGWRAIADNIFWLHIPSSRSVAVDSWRWDQCRRIQAWPEPPTDPKADGWVVSCREHDELGNPTRGTCFWIASWAEALRRGRLLRASILAEYKPATHAEQLTLDDALPAISEDPK